MRIEDHRLIYRAALERDYEAVLFDLDGVLTSTAALHAGCWKQVFDDVLADWAQRTGMPQRPFDAGRDYVAHVDGKARSDGVRDFLRSRGIAVPEGHPDSPADEWSVHGIGNRKQLLVEQALASEPIEAFAGSVRLVNRLRAAGVRTAVVSSSANCDDVLEAAGIADLFELTVDGNDIAELGLQGKPAPDAFLEGARRLAVLPPYAVVVEDAVAGVAAGRAGGFGLVIGVARNATRAELLPAGADVVVDDLAELAR
jgi:alpha,alpha-trehalose phosphorylase